MSMLRRRLMSSQKKKEEVPFYERYLTMEALEDELSVTFDAECEYCVDGDGVWKVLPAYGFVYINKGQFLCFRGNLIPSIYGIGTFSTYQKFNLKGNVMSMIFGDYGKENSSLAGYDYAFRFLFSSCTKLQSVSPDFLHATTLSKGCYFAMFYNCESLKDAPNLPATTLAEECYEYMFYGCIKLVSQITLPAEHLKPYCYYGMFYNCRLLDYIKALFVDVPSSDYTEDWVYNVSPSGTFVKNPNATWDVIGDNGVPEGWTVKFDGEEEPSFEFPLCIYSDECSSTGLMGTCFAYGDYSGLKQYLIEFVKNNGDNDGNYWYIDDVRNFGITIIIDGQYYVTWMDYQEGDAFVSFGHTRCEYHEGTISDSVILYEYDL